MQEQEILTKGDIIRAFENLEISKGISESPEFQKLKQIMIERAQPILREGKKIDIYAISQDEIVVYYYYKRPKYENEFYPCVATESIQYRFEKKEGRSLTVQKLVKTDYFKDKLSAIKNETDISQATAKYIEKVFNENGIQFIDITANYKYPESKAYNNIEEFKDDLNNRATSYCYIERENINTAIVTYKKGKESIQYEAALKGEHGYRKINLISPPSLNPEDVSMGAVRENYIVEQINKEENQKTKEALMEYFIKKGYGARENSKTNELTSGKKRVLTPLNNVGNINIILLSVVVIVAIIALIIILK